MIDRNDSKISYSLVQKHLFDGDFSQGEAQNVTNTNTDSMDGPTIVWVNLFVRSFEKIDDVRMQFR